MLVKYSIATVFLLSFAKSQDADLPNEDDDVALNIYEILHPPKTTPALATSMPPTVPPTTQESKIFDDKQTELTDVRRGKTESVPPKESQRKLNPSSEARLNVSFTENVRNNMHQDDNTTQTDQKPTNVVLPNNSTSKVSFDLVPDTNRTETFPQKTNVLQENQAVSTTVTPTTWEVITGSKGVGGKEDHDASITTSPTVSKLMFTQPTSESKLTTTIPVLTTTLADVYPTTLPMLNFTTVPEVTTTPNDNFNTTASGNETDLIPSLDFTPHVPEDLSHWWKRNKRTGAMIVLLSIIMAIVTCVFARKKGCCPCLSTSSEDERRGLANGDYQQNNGRPAYYKNDSYDPL